MLDQCARCGRSFVRREPFVRGESLRFVKVDPGFEVQTVDTGYFHLSCAPWGDPKYRITRPERQAI